MQFNDTVYGSLQLNILFLLNWCTSSVLVDQPRGMQNLFPGSYHSRFEHSVGVCYLLSAVWSNLVEQVAGLLHDVSAYCLFSLRGLCTWGGSETLHTFQDDVFEMFGQRAAFLKFSGNITSISSFFDDSFYLLLEKPLPTSAQIASICVIGVHYRGKWHMKWFVTFLSQLKIINHQWVFENSLFVNSLNTFTCESKMLLKYWLGVMFQKRLAICSLSAYKYSSYITRKDLFFRTTTMCLENRLICETILSYYWNRWMGQG